MGKNEEEEERSLGWRFGQLLWEIFLLTLALVSLRIVLFTQASLVVQTVKNPPLQW